MFVWDVQCGTTEPVCILVVPDGLSQGLLEFYVVDDPASMVGSDIPPLPISFNSLDLPAPSRWAIAPGSHPDYSALQTRPFPHQPGMTTMRLMMLALSVPLAALLLLAAAPARGQAIPRDEYLHYVPLEQPPLVMRTQASLDFHLFGDPEAPGFRDTTPIDGIDDRRGDRLRELGARFGPIMVLNTTNLPMDFRKFMERSRAFNLEVDTWSLVGNPKELLRSDNVDLLGIADSPCPEIPQGGRDLAGDCLLLDLLRRYSPDDPDFQTLAPRTVPPDRRTFEVMFFDFPGEGPESWKAEFENTFSGLLPSEYRDFLKVYMHPFIHAVRSPLGGDVGYELILQYYFFYPTNDGGNDHEGDWEHINVSVAPRSTVDGLLSAVQVRAILNGNAASDADLDDPLVIRYVDYYFHHQVYRMDYTFPDAYAPREVWQRQLEKEVVERHGERRTWSAVRHNAWWDEDETVVNTHPVCYVGADNKGLDQLLSSPGGKNRDSHGTYPFPGLYKDIGPSGATEQINSSLDVKEYWRDHDGDISGREQRRFGRGEAVPYTTTDRIEVLPDWECVVEPVMTDPTARRDWFWMLLPVRWGYPATESPFAGVVAHAETGNLSPFGPMSQPHWNRPGTEGGSNDYQPHSFETLFPLGFQDTFVNSWGYLNLTLPVLASLPPLDFAWRLVAYPFRAAIQRNDPVFFPTETIPSRFVGLTAGVSNLSFNDDTAALLFNGDPGVEMLARIIISNPDGVASLTPAVDNATAWWWQVNFYLGSRFVTQTTLLHSRSRLALDVVDINGVASTGEMDLNLWEVAGSFRFDLSRSKLRPFLKVGYGWTWYRTEGAAYNGQTLDASAGEWIDQPSFKTFSSILPTSWHAGGGVEIIVYRSGSPFPSGVDVSLVGEATYTQTNLGLDDWLLVAGSDDLSGRGGLVDHVLFKRWTLSAGLNLGF